MSPPRALKLGNKSLSDHKSKVSILFTDSLKNSAQRRDRFIHLNKSCLIWSKHVIGWVHWKCKWVCKLISKELLEAEYLQSYTIMQQLLFLDMQILSFILELATIIEIRCPWGASYNATAHNKASPPPKLMKTSYITALSTSRDTEASSWEVPCYRHWCTYVTKPRCIQKLQECGCLWIIQEMYELINCTWSEWIVAMCGTQTSFLNGLLGFFPLRW